MDRAGEHEGILNYILKRVAGIRIEYVHLYELGSNRRAERLVQKLTLRSKVLQTGSDLSPQLWAEAMNHCNWIQKRLLCAPSNNGIHPIKRNMRSAINFRNIPVLRTPGFSFVYRVPTISQKKIQTRSIHKYFLGMKFEERHCCSFHPNIKSVLVALLSDFKPVRSESLSSFASLKYKVSKHKIIYDALVARENVDDPPTNAYAQSFEHGTFISRPLHFGENTSDSF